MVEVPATVAINNVEIEAQVDAYTPTITADDYSALANKPSINGNVLIGNKSTAELGIDHVALADNLVAYSGTSSSSPYLFRKSPVGVSAELHRLTGATVAWNQIIPNSGSTGEHGGFTFTKNGDGSWTITGTGSTNNAFRNINYSSGVNNMGLVAGHVYFLPKGTTAGGVGVIMYNGTSEYYSSENNDRIFKIGTVNTPTYARLQVSGKNNVDIGTVKVCPNAFDLTQMFGSTMAEAILAMETATEGAGVAFFRSLFPSAYYPYSAPTLASVQTSARVTRGFNQWDEEWEVGGYDNSGAKVTSNDRIRSKNYIPILPGTQYRSTVGGYFFQYGADKALISRNEFYSNTTFTTDNGACYMTFHTYSSYGTVYKHDITIGFSVADMNGVYVPYESSSYPIDDVVLRGIPKLTNGVLSYDGDIYLPSGEVVRRFGEVDLGDLTWSKDSTYNYFRATVTGGKTPASGGTADAVCSNYPIYTGALAGFTASDKVAWVFPSNVSTSPQVVIIDSSHASDTTTQFKTAMDGVKLMYPLASATTEEADPYAEIQKSGETEQFVSTSPVPVGNEAFYAEDLTGVVQNLAPLPTTAGTYKLQVTVSGGTPSYSWVAG